MLVDLDVRRWLRQIAGRLRVYENGYVKSGNPAAVENPDGTFRLMTCKEYDALVSEVQNMARNDGETDAGFNARKEAAQKKLDEVNSDLYGIAGIESGYRNMVTVRDVEAAYKDSFVDFYDPEKSNYICSSILKVIQGLVYAYRARVAVMVSLKVSSGRL